MPAACEFHERRPNTMDQAAPDQRMPHAVRALIVATLFFVPVVYSYLRHKTPGNPDDATLDFADL
jgi:hypothetical protein